MTNWDAECWKITERSVERARSLGAKYGFTFGYSGCENILEEMCELVEWIEENNKHNAWERDLNE